MQQHHKCNTLRCGLLQVAAVREKTSYGCRLKCRLAGECAAKLLFISLVDANVWLHVFEWNRSKCIDKIMCVLKC